MGSLVAPYLSADGAAVHTKSHGDVYWTFLILQSERNFVPLLRR
jgi:hypothetical protein